MLVIEISGFFSLFFYLVFLIDVLMKELKVIALSVATNSFLITFYWEKREVTN